MAEITTTGISQTGLPLWIERMQAQYRVAFGPALEFDTASVQQQEIGIDAENYAEFDEALIAVANGQSLDTATGYQLDFLGSPSGIDRLKATVSVVTLTLTGAAGTTVQGGARAQTAEGVVFVIVRDAPIRARVRGNPMPAPTLAQIQALPTTWTLTINSTVIAPVDLTSVPTLAAAAAAIEGAINVNAAFGLVKVSYNEVTRFFDLSLGGATLFAGNPTGTLADLLGWNDGEISTGIVDAIANSQELGVIEAKAGTIMGIVDTVSGWNTVTNADPADPGRNREIDNVYRARIRRLTQRNSLSSVAAIRAAVEEVEDVTKADVLENDTLAPRTENGVTIEARSIYVLVKGGDNNDIARAIYSSKAGGMVTDGDGVITVNLNPGNSRWTVPIQFTRPTDVEVTVTMTITLLPGFPTDGTARIRQVLVDLVDNLNIGDAIFEGDAYVATLSVPGLRIMGTIAVARKVGSPRYPEPVTDVNGDELLTLATGDITVTIS